LRCLACMRLRRESDILGMNSSSVDQVLEPIAHSRSKRSPTCRLPQFEARFAPGARATLHRQRPRYLGHAR
jgi:hypothetical protein